MDKIFSLNRVFVFFCAALVAIWLALQFVSNSLLSALAERDGRSVFDWHWPDLKLISKVNSLHAEVLSKSPTEAVVKVTGKQILEKTAADRKTLREVGKPTDVSATLTYYHNDRAWILGRVDLP
jgi:hypothetical protein